MSCKPRVALAVCLFALAVVGCIESEDAEGESIAADEHVEAIDELEQVQAKAESISDEMKALNARLNMNQDVGREFVDAIQVGEFIAVLDLLNVSLAEARGIHKAQQTSLHLESTSVEYVNEPRQWLRKMTPQMTAFLPANPQDLDGKPGFVVRSKIKYTGSDIARSDRKQELPPVVGEFLDSLHEKVKLQRENSGIRVSHPTITAQADAEEDARYYVFEFLWQNEASAATADSVSR